MAENVTWGNSHTYVSILNEHEIEITNQEFGPPGDLMMHANFVC